MLVASSLQSGSGMYELIASFAVCPRCGRRERASGANHAPVSEPRAMRTQMLELWARLVELTPGDPPTLRQVDDVQLPEFCASLRQQIATLEAVERLH